MSQPADFAAPVTMAPLKSRHGDAKHPDSDDNSVRAYEAAPDLSNHEDAVFGGTNADGPNYRNVSSAWMPLGYALSVELKWYPYLLL